MGKYAYLKGSLPSTRAYNGSLLTDWLYGSGILFTTITGLIYDAIASLLKIKMWQKPFVTNL